MRPGASVQWHQCHRCVLQRLTESSSLCPRPLPLALYNSEIVLWLVQWTVWVLLGGFVVLAIAMLAVVGFIGTSFVTLPGDVHQVRTYIHTYNYKH